MADMTHAHKEDELHTRVAHLFISYSVTRVLGSQIAILEYVIFKISVTSKNVINLIIRTSAHANKIELSLVTRVTGNGLVREKHIVKNRRQAPFGSN
jgi:hypothetical protein